MSVLTMIDKRVEKKVAKISEYDDRPKNIQEGIGFMQYCLENVFKNKDYDSIEEGIVDSSYRNEINDYGIDAIYVTGDNDFIEAPESLEDYNKDAKFVFHIFQFKKGTGIDVSTLLKLKDGVEKGFINNFISEDQNSYFYNRLINLFELRDEIYERFYTSQITIKLYICFSGMKSNVINNPVTSEHIGSIKSTLNYNGYNNVEIEILGAQELIDFERNQEDIKDIIGYEKSFKYITEKNEKDEQVNGYIAIVNALEIAKLVKKWGASLFEANIRDYYKKNSNNEKILETSASEEEGRFFWSFNNGLTITCKDVEDLPNNKYRLHGLQIVNGCQTSNTLYLALYNYERYEYLTQKETLSKQEQSELDSIKFKGLNENASVLVKIIETQSEELIYRITETTNSQTSIQAFSLKANEDIHKNIEHYFKDFNIYYERRVNYYRNRGISPKEIVDIKKLSQLYLSMIQIKPSQSRTNPKQMFISNYDSVFPSNDVKQVNYILYLVPVLVNMKVERTIRVIQRNKKENDPYKKALMSNGKLHLGCLFLTSLLGKDYTEKGIVNKFPLIQETLNDDEKFNLHFNNALEELKKLVQSFAGMKKEVVGAALRKAELDNRMIRVIRKKGK
ncbi:AIPR family protein [Ureibacillus chungkukjangi]|uniref:AIPR family protein n=1 Tax=Ureibacillus chungkukjangi TaxID=1202712 RepID=UPI00384BD3FF